MPPLISKLNDIFNRTTKRRLAFAVAGSTATSIVDTVAIALVLPLVDLATGKGEESSSVAHLGSLFHTHDLNRLTIIVTAMVMTLFVLKDIGSLAFTWWFTGFIQSERVRTSARILSHMLNSPYSEVSRRSPADLMRTMDSAVVQVFNTTISGLMLSISSGLAIASVIATLLVLAFVPTLILLAYFGLAAFLFNRVAKPRALEAGRVMNEASVAGYKSAFAALGAVKEIILRGSQPVFVERFESSQLRGAYAGRTASFLGALPKYMLEILFILAIGIIVLASPRADGGNQLGMVALFVTAGFRLLPSVTSLMANATSVRVGASALDTVHEEVMAARAQTGSSGVADGPVTRFASELRVDGVWFRYPGAASDVLRGVSLAVPAGTSLALVGSSGAGKTTLVDLLLGLHVPTRGRILCDGRDIAADMRGWRRNVAYVPQDVYILDATLLENVAFDQPKERIDRQRVLQALTEAELNDVLESLPDGLETQLGERGTRLSGGQRQRVGIARALYRKPSLLVLDEATSALDNETEHRISSAIAALHGNVTVVVVAHRLSTVRDVDHIAYLEEGVVKASGTFAELRDSSEGFERLVRLGSLEPPAGQA